MKALQRKSATGGANEAFPAGAPPAPPPEASWGLRLLGLWELVKLGAYMSATLVYMNYASKVRPRLWWMRRTGRAAEADAIVYRMTSAWAQGVMRHFGCRVVVEGAEHMPATSPVVVMCNHQSFYDIPLLMGYLGRPTGFVFKRELFRYPGMRYWMSQMHSESVDRQDTRDALHRMDALGRRVRETGHAMVIFPEGTRTRHPDARMGPFRRGSLRPAEHHGLPVVPVVLDGTRWITKPLAMARTRRGGRCVRLRIAPPRDTRPMSAPEARRFMEAVQEEMMTMHEAIRTEWPCPAPASG